MINIHKFIQLISLSCVITTSACFANTQHNMQWINHKIKTAKSHLTYYKRHKTDLESNLKDIELHISRLSSKQIQIKKDLQISNQKIKQLNIVISKTHKDLLNKQQSLASLIKTEYQLKKQSKLQLVLQHESVDAKLRLAQYLKYIDHYQIQLTADIQQKIKLLQHNKSQLNHVKQTYQTGLQHIITTQKTLKKAIQHRLTIMQSMRKKIATHAKQLDALLSQKQMLLNAIHTANQDVPVNNHLNFAYDFYKPLAWPTKGRIKQTFGIRIDHSQLTTDGIVIKAPAGQAVYAVANGVVIFSKWLPGYGLLMIINHGHGYMTLYGRSQQLLYHNGQTVKKGALIATVGNTGGFAKPGLYFAIRHHGSAMNPKLWCHT